MWVDLFITVYSIMLPLLRSSKQDLKSRCKGTRRISVPPSSWVLKVCVRLLTVPTTWEPSTSWSSDVTASISAFIDICLLWWVASLVLVLRFRKLLFRVRSKRLRLVFWRHFVGLRAWSMHMEQNGVVFIDVVSARSKSPGSKAEIILLVDMPALFGKLASETRLDFRRLSCGGELLSNDAGLDLRRSPCDGELLSTFITCLFSRPYIVVRASLS